MNDNNQIYTFNEWKQMRNVDLANLFYYSFSFHNRDLADSSLKSWTKEYQELNSLFFIKEGFIFQLLNIKDFKPNLDDFKYFEDNGLSNYPIDFLPLTMQYDYNLFNYLLHKSEENIETIINRVSYSKQFLNDNYFNSIYEKTKNIYNKDFLFIKGLINGLTFNKENDIINILNKYSINMTDICNKTELYLSNNTVIYNTRDGQINNEFLKNKILNLLYINLHSIIPNKEIKSKIKL